MAYFEIAREELQSFLSVQFGAKSAFECCLNEVIPKAENIVK